MKTRYVAEYCTGWDENCPDAAKPNMKKVIGDNLEKVVNEAMTKNFTSRDECYAVRLEGLNEYAEWEVIEYYNCFDLSEIA